MYMCGPTVQSAVYNILHELYCTCIVHVLVNKLQVLQRLPNKYISVSDMKCAMQSIFVRLRSVCVAVFLSKKV